MNEIEQVLGSPRQFLDKLFSLIESDGIDVSSFELDHICYRVATLERYSEIKEELSKHGKLLAESQINGRPISNFRLNEPILYNERKIFCIELPSPKQGVSYNEGFEHVEFVIDSNLEDLIRMYPNLPFDKSGMTKASNPDVALKHGDVQYKFHRETIEQVIAREKLQK